MKKPHKIFFSLFAIFLIAARGATVLADNQTVEYHSFIDKTFAPRSAPAQVSKETQEQLEEKDYAVIGEITIIQILKRCKSAESAQEKCETIEQKKSATESLLAEAARRGGEVVTLSADNKSEDRAITGNRCKEWGPGRGYSGMVYERGRWVSKTVFPQECVAWEETLSQELRLVSSGIIWRKDPELAKFQKRQNEFVIAVSLGDLNAVKSLIESGASPNTHDQLGFPVLGLAAFDGTQDVVEFLISKGAKLDSKDFRVSPLWMAAEAGKAEIVRYLLSKGADPDPKSDNGTTALITACFKQRTEIVKVLLEAGAKINASNDVGTTPLLAAVSGMQAEFTKEPYNYLGQDPQIPFMLLKKGINFSAKNKENQIVLNKAFEYARHGKSAAFILNREAGAFGYIDKNGKWAIKPSFQAARSFSEGLAAVVAWCQDTENEKVGFIDKTGKYVIPPRYKFARDFHEGLAIATNDHKKWGFIDKSGNEVIEQQYDFARDFSEGLASVRKEKCGYIDKQGKLVIPFQFDEAYPFHEGIALVGIKDKNKDGKLQYGYIEKTGKWIIPPQYKDAGDFSEGLALVTENTNEKAYIDRSGKTVISINYTNVRGFREGLAAFQENKDKGLWGYMDRKGNVLISPKFAVVYPFSSGFAQVREKASSGIRFINQKGEFINAVEYKEAGIFRDGLTMTMPKKGTAAYIDSSGRPIITFNELSSKACEWSSSPTYLFMFLGYALTSPWRIYAGDFSEGLAPVRVQGDVFLKAWE